MKKLGCLTLAKPTLFQLLFSGHGYVLEDLVSAGANIDLQENEGATALYLAAYFEKNEVVFMVFTNLRF